MTQDELVARTKRFALRVMKLVDALPRTRNGNTIAAQLSRSGMSVAANYRAACRGRSRAEFASKLGIAEEEADESALWMELIMEGGLMKTSRVTALHSEALELVAILAKSRITSIRNQRPIANRKLQIAKQ